MSLLSSRIRSFGYAFAGIRFLILTQPHAWIHLAATIVVIAAGLILGISTHEWCMIALAIGGVWCAEGLNTAVEQLCDRVSVEHDPLIGRAKDLAAGAVLLMCVAALAVGLIIFAPRLLTLIRAYATLEGTLV